MSQDAAAVNDEPLLVLANVESAYGPIRAIRGVSLKVQRRELLITVRDSGPGLPEGFQMRGTGTLGMQLVTTLTRQLRGKIAAHNDHGAVFELAYPL